VDSKDDIIKEIEEGFALLVYDLPYDPRNSKLVSWYKWACSVLRFLGYPIQYSVVLLPVSKIGDAKRVIDKIVKKLEWNGLKSYTQYVDVKIIRFTPKGKEDVTMLIELFKECLRDTMEYAKREAVKKLREGEDYRRVREYLRKILSRLRKQDALKLIQYDEELKRLYASLSTLVVGV